MTQDLMQGLLTKMDWHDKRQKVLAENIASADTPNAVPYDIKAPDFKELLQSTSKHSLNSVPSVGMAATNEKHLTAEGASLTGAKVKEIKQKETYEVAPAGNAIILEEQLLKMNENATEHRLISNLYQKNMEMIKASTK